MPEKERALKHKKVPPRRKDPRDEDCDLWVELSDDMGEEEECFAVCSQNEALEKIRELLPRVDGSRFYLTIEHDARRNKCTGG